MTRIGLNAGLLNLDPNYRSAGISNYIRHLLANLEMPAGLRLEVFSPKPALADRQPTTGWHFAGASVKHPLVRIVWEQTILPAWCQALGIRVLHSPAYVAPLALAARSIVTVHDLSFELFPAMFNRSNSFYLSRFTRLSLSRADLVIAVSEATKRDIIKLYSIRPERITVIHNGVDERFVPASAEVVEGIKRRRGLPERFFFYCGTLEPRKNVGGLIRAYARLPADLRAAMPLIVAGAAGWHFKPVFHLAESLGLADGVRFVGYIGREEQSLWYNAATVFVYPSLYEGFGLPPLEAMACGAPTIVSDRGSLPEVVGSGAIIVDPTNYDGLAAEMSRLAQDAELRRDLSRRGIQQAAGFDWRQTARQVERLYADVATDLA